MPSRWRPQMAARIARAGPGAGSAAWPAWPSACWRHRPGTGCRATRSPRLLRPRLPPPPRPPRPAAAQTLVAAAQPAARPAPATGVAPAPPAAIAVAPAPPPPTVAVAAVAPAPIPPFLPPQPAPSPITKAIAPASAAGANIALTLQQLPEPARRHLGALKLGGAIHSQRAADRLLIVDGQVVREGDTVAPGVVLEQIRPRSAIFRWQQYSVELAH